VLKTIKEASGSRTAFLYHRKCVLYRLPSANADWNLLLWTNV